MKVLIDGKEVECLNDVKVIWDDTPDENMELHMAATSEGVILDVYGTDDNGGTCERTASLLTDDLGEICH
jgi:hypothetical protein